MSEVRFSVTPDRRGGLVVCYSPGSAMRAALEVTGPPTSVTQPDPTTTLVVGPNGRTTVRAYNEGE